VGFTIEAGPSIGLAGVRNTSHAEGAQLAFDCSWVRGVDFERARFGRPGGSPAMYAVLPHEGDPLPTAILLELTIAAATTNPSCWPADWISSAYAYMNGQDPDAARRELGQLEAGRRAGAAQADADRADLFRGALGDVGESFAELPERVGTTVGKVAGGVTGLVGKVAGDAAAGLLRGLGPWFTVGLAGLAVVAVAAAARRASA
jgi:hypothetical protein